jgi:hypothetical protein
MTESVVGCPPVPSSDLFGARLSQEQVSDLTVARAVAEAIRRVPGVVDLGAKCFPRATTFGSGQSVSGVAIRHATGGKLALEVHVIVSSVPPARPGAECQAVQPLPDMQEHSVLIHLANEIRTLVYRAVEHMGVDTLSAVDVLIDDLK